MPVSPFLWLLIVFDFSIRKCLLLLSCVISWIISCEHIAHDGRATLAVPQLTSYLIIHTDNRQNGPMDSCTDWLTGSGPRLYIPSRDKEIHYSTLYSVLSVGPRLQPPCHRYIRCTQIVPQMSKSLLLYICAYLWNIFFVLVHPAGWGKEEEASTNEGGGPERSPE